jgi:lactoylglutathione lyase
MNEAGMNIHHIAIWTHNLDDLAAFWVRAFGAEVGPIYVSRNRPGFRSCWLTLADGPKIELMTGPWVEAQPQSERDGYAHVALSAGTRAEVDRVAARLAQDGALVSGPRVTGDGFYEAVLRDTDGNLIEITA